jgi:hypothetical protein
MVECLWEGYEVTMFNAISQLRKQIIENELAVTHSEDRWIASFEWFPPATFEQIQEVEERLSFSLPHDHKKFLSEISNGAVLFHEKEYSQWGFKLFSTLEIVEKQHEWKKSFPVTWKSSIIAFGKLFGEANVLVFDLRRPTKDSLSYMVLEGNAYDKFSDWAILSRSFHEWLDHLVTAQGDKYWLWK